MKKILSTLAAAANLSSLNACGVQNEDSTQKSLSDWFKKSESETTESTLPSPTAHGAKSFSFNLYEYLKTSSTPLKAYTQTSANDGEAAYPQTFEAPEDMSDTSENVEPMFDLGFGNKRMFRVENNLILAGSASDRKISAQYYVDAYAVGRKLSTAGHAFDVTSTAAAESLTANLDVRFMGASVYAKKIAAEYDFPLVRDFTVEGTAPIYTIPGLGLTVRTTVGGELGVKVAAGVGQTNTLITKIEPRADIHAALAGGISALLFAKAEAVGSVVMLKTKMPTVTEIGIDAVKTVHGSFKLIPFTVDALIGKIDLVASVGVENALPSGVKASWKKLATKILGETYEYTFNVWKTPGVTAAKVPGTESSF